MSKKNRHRNKRPQVKGYSDAGASTTKRALQGFNARSGAPSEDIDKNNSILRQRSRMLYMAAPVATSAINTNRTKVVGTGLTLKSLIDRTLIGMSTEAVKVWQKKTEAEFKMWAGKRQNCDALGLNNFEGLQQVAVKSWLMSGDVFALIKRYEPTPFNPYSLRLHIIEADRVSTPSAFIGGGYATGLTEGKVPDGKPGAGNKIFDGVEVDKNGMVVAYYICNTHPYQYSVEKKVWTRIPAYGEKTGLPNILHIMDAERPDQYRGVPYLAPVIETLLQQRRYTESELMAALVQSFFSAWVETNTNPSVIPFNEVGDGDISGVPDSNSGSVEGEESYSPNEYEMGPGTVVHLEEGESVKFGNPNIPTAGFETFTKALCRLMGAALEIPYDVLIKEFNSSYSASRGALLEAWEAFRMRRKWLVDSFCQPVYELFLSEAVALGRIKAPGFFTDPVIRNAWCGARWIGPVQGQLDPKKEAEAQILLINKGLKTHEQATIELGGGDWMENVEQLKIENELLSAAGGNREIMIKPAEEKEKTE